MDAVSAAGKLGSSEAGIRVFQDFFVDMDLPVALTRNDEISVPVVCYNYLDQPQNVELGLEAGGWCEIMGTAAKEIELGPNEVRSVMFRIKAKDVGTHQLRLLARGERLSDAVQRLINVRPDGTESEKIESGVLALSVDHSFHVPTNAIPNSASLLLKIYPSTFSEVVEGLENIFKKPYGCFEQTSSVTYPNVMALQYMKRTKQITPEIEVKARKFISAGYQRLLTFEVKGGGFDWFGDPPADEMLTAYGILEFTDMAKVHDVDQAVIDRASSWLMSKQDSDGSWSRSARFSRHAQGAINKSMPTAYATWALAEAEIRGGQMDDAFSWLRKNLSRENDPYTIALAANAFLARNDRDPFGRELVRWLLASFTTEDDIAYIRSSGNGAMYSRGLCLDIETTSLAAMAMIKGGLYPETVKQSLTWITKQKDRFGTFPSTQATILAMKALIAGTGQTLMKDITSNIEFTVNGQPAGSVRVTPESSDLMQMVVLTEHLKPGNNRIRITQDEETGLPYQLVGAYWVPEKTPKRLSKKELEIQVDYDRTQLSVDDILQCTVEIRRNGATPVNMAIIDLGVPPGFKVDPSAFRKLVKSGVLAKYELTGNQCILYVRNIQPGKPLRFGYKLKALYPIRAKVRPSRVYEYYQPENEDRTSYQEIVVE